MKFNNPHVPESGSPVEIWRGQVYVKSDFVIIRKSWVRFHSTRRPGMQASVFAGVFSRCVLAKEEMMGKEKILVVDDEYHIRLLYQEELQLEGYDAVTSDGSENILDVLAREKPQVIVLDIKLEGNRSGLDLLQEIRGQDQSIPVILCTAYDSFQHDLKSIAADFYVVKSVELTELKSKVEQALRKAEKQGSPAEGGPPSYF